LLLASVFHTDKNHSVVQTYNATTFKICDADQDINTTEWSVSNPEYSKDAVTVSVPLLKEGPTYFFSNFYDGEQCMNNQKFAINVTHGQGLPDSLKDPAPDAPAPASPDDVPANDVPANFDHPIDDNSTTTDPLKPVAGFGNRNLAQFGFGIFTVSFGALGLFA
jgi:Plastocyanin-like domain